METTGIAFDQGVKRTEAGTPAGASVVTAQSESGKTTARVDIRKFRDHIFNEDPAKNKGKLNLFRGLGYDREDSGRLAQEFGRQGATEYEQGNFELGKSDMYGQHITIEIEVNGVGTAEGESKIFISAWMIEQDGSIRLVTPMAGFADDSQV